MIESRVVYNYDISLDVQRFRAIPPEIIPQQKEYIARQLVTDVGERLRLSESTSVFAIRDGQLIGQGSDESFLDVIERGRRHREVHGNPIDRPREAAEVIGFKPIQEVAVDPNTPDGAFAVSISKKGGRGSIYQLNFFDVFVKQGDRVVATRYLSNLSDEEYSQKVKILNPWYGDVLTKDSSDVEYLSTPIFVHPFSGLDTREKIYDLFFPDVQALKPEEFEKVLHEITPLITSYINTLAENPADIVFLQMAYNSILNKADKVAEDINSGYYEPGELVLFTRREVMKWGSEDPKPVAGGCGTSGSNNIFSVSQFSSLNKNLLGNKDSHYEFEEGKCVGCGTDPAMVGPCGLCKPCDNKERSKNGSVLLN